MQEFIDLVTSKLGVGEAESKSATSGIFGFVKDKLDDSSFKDLVGKIPGASEFLAENESAGGEPAAKESGGGGLMGSLTSMAGGLLGGKAAGMAGVASAIAASGIGVDKAGSFLTLLMNFLKDKLGADGFGALAAKLPDLGGGDDK